MLLPEIYLIPYFPYFFVLSIFFVCFFQKLTLYLQKQYQLKFWVSRFQELSYALMKKIYQKKKLLMSIHFLR